ncbi:MAG: hypothetical protein INR62_05845 [Rhodospirillales bacterium]|nr:hypothetical protein [Acetobacter sp.]
MTFPWPQILMGFLITLGAVGLGTVAFEVLPERYRPSLHLTRRRSSPDRRRPF